MTDDLGKLGKAVLYLIVGAFAIWTAFIAWGDFQTLPERWRGYIGAAALLLAVTCWRVYKNGEALDALRAEVTQLRRLLEGRRP